MGLNGPKQHQRSAKTFQDKETANQSCLITKSSEQGIITNNYQIRLMVVYGFIEQFPGALYAQFLLLPEVLEHFIDEYLQLFLK